MEEYPQLKDFLDALRTVLDLFTIFCGCKDKLIELVKLGRISLKLRGKKLIEVQELLSDAKEKVLSILRVSRSVEKRSFRAMTKTRYKEIHEGREPEEDGLVCSKRLRRGQLVDVVYIPKTHEDEWELDLQEEEAVEERDVYNSGQVQDTSNI